MTGHVPKPGFPKGRLWCIENEGKRRRDGSMLLTCPNCDTVFRVDGEKIGAAGQAVRCSVCAHVWQAAPPMLVEEAEPGEMASALRTVLGSFLVMLLLLGGIVGVVFERATITAYAPGLIGVFQQIGLSVRPDTEHLRIVDLRADYAGDTMRLSGQLQNNAAFFAHAPLLEVRVVSASGESLASRIIRADDAVIRPAMTSGFFTQLVFEASNEPTVTVTMRDDPVVRQ
ncbi:MAG: DUF3426 domain-containing protein [Rhodobiaceae bacterium]|jgi:predicted Zn finger-like uncharacterized protein